MLPEIFRDTMMMAPAATHIRGFTAPTWSTQPTVLMNIASSNSPMSKDEIYRNFGKMLFVEPSTSGSKVNAELAEEPMSI